MRPRRDWCVKLAAAAVVCAGCSRAPASPQGSAGPSQPDPASAVASPSFATPLPDGGYASALIENVPHVVQKPDFCGEAATEMYLRALGKPVDQDQVFALSAMPPERGMGATTHELKTALVRLGFDVGPVWHVLLAVEAQTELAHRFEELHADLARGVPSIVCMHYDDRPHTSEHFRLVLGYDAERDEVIYHEPAVADGAYRRMPRAKFLALWPLKYDARLWTVIRLRLDAASIKLPDPVVGVSPADYAQAVMRLRPTVPTGFTVVVEPPFIVVGNDVQARVRERASGTVRWTVNRLKRDFFTRDPEHILTIWLLKDAASYRRFVQERFGEAPSTPYGFYSDRQHALVMNIATGGGTLVHEIVHPFMEANFPECPAWFNEGLGSLFEQSADRDGHIVGLTNWRLAGLQRSIRSGELPSFRELTSTTSHQFYDQDPGTNYAQARYLLYYLQEHGLLLRYAREFMQNHRRDPTGYQTLQAVLGEPDLGAFQKRWEAYVLGLRFP